MARVLRIDELREACHRLLDAVEEQFGGEIDLDAFPFILAEYWAFDPRTAYALDCHPELRIQAGDVTDDLEEVRDLLHRSEGEVFLGHDLGHLCGLLGLLAFMDYPERDTAETAITDR